MAFIRVMRCKDAPHVFHQYSKQMQARTDKLEPAWLNTETQETMLELPDEKPKRAPRKKIAAKKTAEDKQLEETLKALGD